METNWVVMEGVTKKYGKQEALRDISCTLPAGRIVGLVGSNGAGKSTLLRHIVGLVLPDRGRCLTFGTPADQLGEKELREIGYVDQEARLIEWLTTLQMLNYLQAFYPSWDEALCARLVKRFELDLDKKVGALSPGNRQKLAIIGAVSHRPKLLLLDEPASGLDPLARADFLALLLELIQETDRTIVISSHILTDIEKVVDHVLIMHAGVLRQNLNLDDLREQYIEARIAERVDDQNLPEGFIERVPAAGGLRVIYRAAQKPSVQRWAEQRGHSVELHPVSFEDIYRLETRGPR